MDNLIRMDSAGNRQAVLEFWVIHGMTTQQRRLRLVDYIQSAAQDVAQHRDIHLALGETYYIQRR